MIAYIVGVTPRCFPQTAAVAATISSSNGIVVFARKFTNRFVPGLAYLVPAERHGNRSLTPIVSATSSPAFAMLYSRPPRSKAQK